MNLKKVFLGILFSALIAGSSMADTYQLDLQKSSLHWTGRKAIGSSHNGFLKFQSGNLEVKNNQVVSAIFVVDMASLSNKDLSTKPDMQKKLVGHLKSADFFNVEKFPTATFKVTSTEKKSDKELLLKGTLTILGKTEPVEVLAHVEKTKTGGKGHANLVLDRTRWNIKYGSGKFFKNLGDKLINDEIDLELDIIFNKK